MICFLFFFFSSRRRHTRFDCDWSSDVCSSDLAPGRVARPTGADEPVGFPPALQGSDGVEPAPVPEAAAPARSEERRVGKECRSRGSTDHEKKKQESYRCSMIYAKSLSRFC